MEMNDFKSRREILDSYAKQRRDRMGDAIGDYLTDEAVDARQAYEEMLQEVQYWIDYHKKFLGKAQDLHALMNGERPVISNNK